MLQYSIKCLEVTALMFPLKATSTLHKSIFVIFTFLSIFGRLQLVVLNLADRLLQDIFYNCYYLLTKKKLMDSEAFKECGKMVVDYIADYMDNIRDRYRWFPFF